jgi:hypothetical protein
MKALGALIALVGAFFWVWPKPLIRGLIACGILEPEGGRLVVDAYRILFAMPWITLFGLLMFLTAHISDALRRPARISRIDRLSRGRGRTRR